MVDLAGIIREIPSKAARLEESSARGHSSASAVELDSRLLDWKAQLPQQLALNISSLDEAELVTKQKVVLRLRESTIMLHSKGND